MLVFTVCDMCPVSWHFKCSWKIFFGALEIYEGKKEERSSPRISRSWSCLKSRDAIVLDYYYTKGRRDNNTPVERSSPASSENCFCHWERERHSWKITQIRRLNLKYISRRVPLWRFMVAFVASRHQKTSWDTGATEIYASPPSFWNARQPNEMQETRTKLIYNRVARISFAKTISIRSVQLCVD